MLSPVIGLVLGFAFMAIAVTGCSGRRVAAKVDRVFRLASSSRPALYSLGHGGNDAQKTMGDHRGRSDRRRQLECSTAREHGAVLGRPRVSAAMAFGTLTGGWRIVKTMGMGITHLKPVGGFCAETAGATTLFLATALQIPVSTTHTITGAIVGVGSVVKARGIRWGLATRIVWAWIFTFPAPRRSRRSRSTSRAWLARYDPGVTARWDVIVIGGGHNGLCAAGLLAKRGRRVAVLERRHKVGGAAMTENPWGPDYKMTALSYVVSLMPPTILEELELAKSATRSTRSSRISRRSAMAATSDVRRPGAAARRDRQVLRG